MCGHPERQVDLVFRVSATDRYTVIATGLINTVHTRYQQRDGTCFAISRSDWEQENNVLCSFSTAANLPVSLQIRVCILDTLTFQNKNSTKKYCVSMVHNSPRELLNWRLEISLNYLVLCEAGGACSEHGRNDKLISTQLQSLI